MKKILGAAALIACASVTTADAKDKPAQLSGLELQQIQAGDFEAPVEVSFPSVMTVLQDSGYCVENASKETGLISGIASTQSKTTLNLFWGWGSKKRTPVVSAFIESRGPNMSRIRLNFVMATAKSRGYGISSSDEEVVTDVAPYRDAFERIEKEIFIRQAMNAPSAATATTQASATGPAVMTPAPH